MGLKGGGRRCRRWGRGADWSLEGPGQPMTWVALMRARWAVPGHTSCLVAQSPSLSRHACKTLAAAVLGRCPAPLGAVFHLHRLRCGWTCCPSRPWAGLGGIGHGLESRKRKLAIYHEHGYVYHERGPCTTRGVLVPREGVLTKGSHGVGWFCSSPSEWIMGTLTSYPPSSAPRRVL